MTDVITSPKTDADLPLRGGHKQHEGLQVWLYPDEIETLIYCVDATERESKIDIPERDRLIGKLRGYLKSKKLL